MKEKEAFEAAACKHAVKSMAGQKASGEAREDFGYHVSAWCCTVLHGAVGAEGGLLWVCHVGLGGAVLTCEGLQGAQGGGLWVLHGAARCGGG